MASSLNTPKTNPLLKSVCLRPTPTELPLSSAINISFHVWMGGWVWLKGPRVASVARLHVILSSVNKTSLFVKSPQEQNVPLQQECVACPHVLLCVSVYVCVCWSHFGGWLFSLAFGLSLGSLASELCYYQSLVTRRHEQKCIRKYSSLQNPFTDLDV